MNNEFILLCDDLKKAGIKEGMVVVVHSSFKALGLKENGPTEVIKAFKTIVGENGTLLFPTLTYSSVTRTNPYFSYHNTPSCVGILSETFRKSEHVYRSFNPVHSVCAWGKYAKELTSKHHLDSVSIGPNSPYMLLPEYNGKIFMLGCGLLPNTFMHGIENAAHAPYRETKYIVDYTMEDQNGVKSTFTGFLPDMSNYQQRYDRVEDILEYPNIIKSTVLNAESYLIDANKLLESGMKAIQKNPLYFVDKIK